MQSPHIKFTIHGNHEYLDGNPIPFERAVKGHWRERSSRYMNWQAYVRQQFYTQHRDILSQLFDDTNVPAKRKLTQAFLMKPFKHFGTRIHVHSRIYFANKTHGDSDNIQKGIVDALFVEDKYVAGSYDFEYSVDKKGRVEVEIIIGDKII